MNSDLIDLLRSLDAEGVKYLIVGGYAVGFHAEPRYTKDIDLWVSTDAANAEAVYRVLSDFGAPLDGVTVDDFKNPELFYQMGLPPNRVDVLMGLPGVAFEEAWPNRVEADVEGTVFNYISLEDLLAAKKASGREQDLRDVQALELRLSIEEDDKGPGDKNA